MFNKRAKNVIVKIALMCSISGAGFYAGAQLQPHSGIAYAKTVYKTTTITSMRRGMSNDEKLIVKIPTNQAVDVKAVYKNGAWAKIAWNNKTGYIRTMYLQPSKNSSSSTPSSSKKFVKTGTSYQSDGYHMYTVDTVSLRKSASESSQTLGVVKKGSDFLLIDQSGTYYKIYVNNKYGWIPIKSTANYQKNTSSQSSNTLNSSSKPSSKQLGASSGSSETTSSKQSLQKDGYHMVTTSDVNFRSSPSTKGRKLATLPKASDLLIIDRAGDWFKVYANRRYGYVHKNFLADYGSSAANKALANTPKDTPSKSTSNNSSASSSSSKQSLQSDGYHMVTTTSVNFRSGASTGTKKLGTLSKGSDLLIIDRKGDWFKVYANKRYGYVHKNFLADYGTSTANKALAESSTSSQAKPSNNNSSSNSSSNNSTSSNSSYGQSLRSDGYHMVAKRQTVLKKGAGSNYKTRGTLSKGSDVLIIDQKGSWYKVYYNKAYSWVKKSDLTDYKKGSSESSNSSSSNNGSSGTISQSSKKIGGTRSSAVTINKMGSYKDINIKVSGSLSGTKPSEVSVFLNGSYLNNGKISGNKFTYTIPSNITKPGSNQLRIQVSSSKGLLYQTESFTVAKKPTILVDPGHGGRDPGAIGKLNGKDIYEKDYAIKFATNLSKELRRLGFKVDMSRTGDQTLHRTQRIATVHQSDPDLFFSVHHNAASKSASGALTLYPSYKVNPSSQAVFSESQTLSQMLGKAYASSGMYYRGAYQDKDISGGSLYMLRNSNTRSILTEIGFITNSNDLKKIMNPTFQQELPKHMAKQIHNFFYK